MDYHIPPPISEQQKALIKAFEAFEGDADMALDYLIEMSRTLPLMPRELRIDDNLVPDCQAKVWVTHRHHQGRTFFQGDSNAMITKGMLAALLHVFSGQKDEEIIGADLSFIKQIGLTTLLGMQRRSGLGKMVAYIQQAASDNASEKNGHHGLT